jgi:hypothetical protein
MIDLLFIIIPCPNAAVHRPLPAASARLATVRCDGLFAGSAHPIIPAMNAPQTASDQQTIQSAAAVYDNHLTFTQMSVITMTTVNAPMLEPQNRKAWRAV